MRLFHTRHCDISTSKLDLTLFQKSRFYPENIGVVASKSRMQKIKDANQLDGPKMRSQKHLMFDKSEIKGGFDV